MERLRNPEKITERCLPVGQILINILPELNKRLTMDEHSHDVFGYGCILYVDRVPVCGVYPDKLREWETHNIQIAGLANNVEIHNMPISSGSLGPYFILFNDEGRFYARGRKYHDWDSKQTRYLTAQEAAAIRIAGKLSLSTLRELPK